MLDAIGRPLLARLDDAITGLHRYVRAWRAVLDGECWTELEAAGCADTCSGAA